MHKVQFLSQLLGLKETPTTENGVNEKGQHIQHLGPICTTKYSSNTFSCHLTKTVRPSYDFACE